MAHIALNFKLAQELADKIFENIDDNGLAEIRMLADLFCGNVSVESYIAGTEEEEDDGG